MVNTLVFGAVQCCGVCLSEDTIVYEHDRVDKIRVDSHADILHVGSGL